jgi:hypothetical protein
LATGDGESVLTPMPAPVSCGTVRALTKPGGQGMQKRKLKTGAVGETGVREAA